jgi:succinoglycan biosynthesis transport protein ExoP
MEKRSSQPPSSDIDKNFVPPVIETQAFLGSEGQGDESSLREYFGIIRRRGLVIAAVVVAVMSHVTYSALKQKPLYEGSFRLLVEPLNKENTLLELTSGQGSNSSSSNLDYDSQIQVLKSPELMTGIVKQLETTYPNIKYDSLVNSLTIIRLGETKIIEIRYQNNDPTKIKVVLDNLAMAYSNYSLETRQTSLRQGLQFVEKQLKSMHDRVDQLQKDLQSFRQRYNFIDPNTQTQQIISQATALTEKRQAIDQQLAAARAGLSNLQRETGEKAVLNSGGVYQGLITQLRQLEIQIAQESIRFQDSNPTMQSLIEKREKILSLLKDEAQRYLDVRLAEVVTEVDSLEVQSQELAKEEQKLEQQRQQFPVLAREYIELQRKLQVATESLNRFLTTREALQIQVAQTEIPWELIQAPVQPSVPKSPDIKRNLITGFIGSLVLGLGVALLLEKLDDTYHSVDSLKKIKQPLLGAIPFEKQLQHSLSPTSKPRIPIRVVPDSLSRYLKGLAAIIEQQDTNYSTQFLEALRVVCTNIQLLSSDKPIRSVVISSAMAGDGKSTAAFHLAQIATAMGQRVLLVDADLRQPTIHTLSELNNQWGLSNLISTNLPAGEVIRQPEFMNQLSILTAGPIPPDPTKLLSSEKMKRLMEDFHNNFDLVIYDTPSLVGLADANLIAPHTDGILLVVRMDKTNRSKLKRALDSLKLSRINVLGIVANAQRLNFDDY